MRQRKLGDDVQVLEGLSVRRKGQTFDEAGDTDEAVISTTARDNSGLGDIVDITGGDFTDFWKNPRVLWMHGRAGLSFPVGRALSLDLRGNDLWAKWVWQPWGQGVSDEAKKIDDVHRMWNADFIGALSIRLIIKEADPLDERAGWWGPLHIHKWVLREFSLVDVPANQDATRRDAAKRCFKMFLGSETLRRIERRTMKSLREMPMPALEQVPEVLAADLDVFKQLSQLTFQTLESLNHG